MGLETRGFITSRASIFSLSSSPWVWWLWGRKMIIARSFLTGACHSLSCTSRMTSTPLYTSRAYDLRRGSKLIVIFIFSIRLENLMKESPIDTTVDYLIHLSLLRRKFPSPFCFQTPVFFTQGEKRDFVTNCDQTMLSFYIYLILKSEIDEASPKI
jgi:hypothetical protein